jgi:rhodanese-related sulfurtransferase
MKKLNKILIVVAALFTVSIATACNSAQTTNSNSESTAIVSDSTKPSDTKTSGKIIVDVRTIEEWNGDGHANCSVNIPLSDLSTKIEDLKKYQEITLVCRSGNRANTAKSMLEEAGLKNITNLGAWQNIQCK